MLTDKQIRKLMIYRACGYHIDEIAEQLKVSRKTVENWLHRLKIMSEDNGINETFLKYFDIWIFPKIID